MNVGRINYGPKFQGKLQYNQRPGSFATVDAKDIVKVERSLHDGFARLTIKTNYGQRNDDVLLHGTKMQAYIDFLSIYNQAVAAPDGVTIVY